MNQWAAADVLDLDRLGVPRAQHELEPRDLRRPERAGWLDPGRSLADEERARPRIIGAFVAAAEHTQLRRVTRDQRELSDSRGLVRGPDDDQAERLLEGAATAMQTRHRPVGLPYP